MFFEIKNFNTINDVKIQIDETNDKIINLIGLNGSGKTNILKSIEAFCDKKISLEKYKPTMVSSEIDWDEWSDEEYNKVLELVKEENNNRYIYYEKNMSENTKQQLLEKIKKIQLTKEIYKDLITENIYKINVIKTDEYYAYIYDEIHFSLLPFSYFLIYATKHIQEKYKESTPIISLFQKVSLVEVLDEQSLNSYGKYFFDLLEDKLVERIENKVGISKIQKVELVNIVKQINEIQNFYNLNQLPDFEFIQNSAKELSLDYEYDIKILNDVKDPKYSSIVSFYKSANNGVFELAKETAEEFKKDKNIQDEHKIRRNKEKIKSLCVKSYNAIFKQNDIYAKPNFHFDGSSLKITVSTIKKFLINIDDNTDMNSDGYKAILCLIINLRKFIFEAKQNPTKEYILLADEIEKNIHPLAQMKLIKYILNEVKEISNLKIFLTTHSPFLINNSKEVLNNVVLRNEYGFTLLIPKKDIKNEITEDNIVLKVHDILQQNRLFEDFYKIY